MPTKQYTLRLPEETLAQLKDRHAETFAMHRLSFNTWLLNRIQLSFTVEET
jgi:hypothetical protein